MPLGQTDGTHTVGRMSLGLEGDFAVIFNNYSFGGFSSHDVPSTVSESTLWDGMDITESVKIRK